MLIQEKAGHILSFDIGNRTVDYLVLEWYETRKRILRKKTLNGTEISLKFLAENPMHTEGDILFSDDDTVIVVSVAECACLVVVPRNMFEMASACYEIGNKHLPLFYEEEQLLVPYEQPLYNLLLSQGYGIKKDNKKLLNPLKTTVAAHTANGAESLFTKIMKLKPNQP